MKAEMEVKRIALSDIFLTVQNPRQDAPDDPTLAGLAASMGPEADPVLAQPPVVEDLGGSKYRTISGERRIRAAAMSGWQTIECLVRPALAPLVAHRLRLVENLHRKELHPLDQAVALKLAWHSTNAVAMGLTEQVTVILDKEQVPAETLTELETLLAQHGFAPNHPLVSWDETLDSLGVELDKERRKKLLQVLGVAPEVQAQLRQMDITEASLRALAKLAPEDQTRLVEEMAEDPDLTRKVRRISHAVRAHDYDLDEALAEARGVMFEKTEDGRQETDPVRLPSSVPGPVDEALAELVVQLMETAHALKTTLERLKETARENPFPDFPDPWGTYALETLANLRDALEPFPQKE